MFQIKENIYYSLFKDTVYLRDVNKKTEYLFNEIVFDILNELKEPKTLENLLENLRKIYVLPPPRIFCLITALIPALKLI